LSLPCLGVVAIVAAFVVDYRSILVTCDRGMGERAMQELLCQDLQAEHMNMRFELIVLIML
jgi:hypothetical protein